MIVLLDDAQRQHLALALEAHCRALQRNGLAVPAELRQLCGALADSNGQPRPARAERPVEPDADGMALAVDYRVAARWISVSERTVRRLVGSDRLAAVDIGGCRRIRVQDLAQYVADLSPTNAAEPPTRASTSPPQTSCRSVGRGIDAETACARQPMGQASAASDSGGS